MEHYKKIHSILKQEAELHKSKWRESQRFVAPLRGSFDRKPNQARTIDHKELLDAHATWCLKVFGSGLTSGLTSPSRPWFKLGLADTDLVKFRPVKEYLENCEKIMMAAFAKSNIYGIFNAVYEELGAFGTASFSIEEDQKDFIRGKSFTSGEFAVGVDETGRANEFAREFYLTVKQTVEKFGVDNVSIETKNAYNNKNFLGWVKIRHLICANYEQDIQYLDARNKNFISLYWEDRMQSDKFLKVSGYDFYPIISPRWTVATTSDVWGDGPAVEAMGDIKMLQKLKRDLLEGIEKVNRPPVQADASVDEINAFPGGISRTSQTMPNAGIRPAYQISPDINAIRAQIMDTKKDIEKFFYVDMFLMMQGDTRSNVTAREIVERHEEKLLMLGPTLERLENEMLDPAIDITFNYLNRMQILPKPPRELEGVDLKVEYVSTLAQAQKMVATTAINQFTSFVGSLAAVSPDVLDVLDPVGAAIEYGEAIGISSKSMRSRQEAEEIQKQRQMAAAQAQQAQDMAAMAQSAKVMADTQLDNNSALDAMLGIRE